METFRERRKKALAECVKRSGLDLINVAFLAGLTQQGMGRIMNSDSGVLDSNVDYIEHATGWRIVFTVEKIPE